MSSINQAHAPERSKFHQDCPEALRVEENFTARVLREFVWRRANVKNDFAMLCIVGREGSGKSHTAMSIAEKCDPSFSSERVFFKPANFLEYVNEEDTGTGDAIVLDEAGVGLGVRTWYEEAQVMMNQALQTIRDDNLIILTTLPRLSELDSQTRGRLHAYLEMETLHPGEYATFRWKHIKPRRDERDELLKFYPRLPRGGRLHKLKSLGIGPPSDELATAYEERKAAFKQDLYERTVENYREEENTELSEREIAEKIMSNGSEEFVKEHPANGQRFIDKDLIQMEYGISGRKANRVRKVLREEAEVETDAA